MWSPDAQCNLGETIASCLPCCQKDVYEGIPNQCPPWKSPALSFLVPEFPITMTLPKLALTSLVFVCNCIILLMHRTTRPCKALPPILTFLGCVIKHRILIRVLQDLLAMFFLFFFGGGGKLFRRILGTIPYQPKSNAAFNCVPNNHTTQMSAKKNIHGSELPVKKHFCPSPRFGNCVSNPYVWHMYEQIILTWWCICIALIIEINRIYALEIEK